jgi:TetR/AcrR family transcriptional repressor of nem operon
MREGATLTTAKPLPATERGRRTRADILAAAALLIYERGVRATSLDDVLAAARCGKSQLYHYFEDKADLVGAVIDQQLDYVLAAQPALARIESLETFDVWLTGVAEMHSADGGPFACPLGKIAAELMTDEVFRPRLDTAFDRWVNLLAEGLRTMRDRGELDETADPERLAASVIAMLQGGMLLGRVRADLTSMLDVIAAARTHVHRWSRPD